MGHGAFVITFMVLSICSSFIPKAGTGHTDIEAGNIDARNWSGSLAVRFSSSENACHTRIAANVITIHPIRPFLTILH